MTLAQLLQTGIISTEQMFENFNIHYNTESEKTDLQSFIINHFLLREVGAETPSMFLYFFNDTILYNVPEYNRLYDYMVKVNELDSPFFDYLRDGVKTNTLESTGNETDLTNKENKVDSNSGISKNVTSTFNATDSITIDDLPYSRRSISDDYATNLKKDSKNQTTEATDESNENVSSNQTITSDSTKTTKKDAINTETWKESGVNGDIAKKFAIYKKEFITLQNLWLKWLDSCFIQLY